ANTGRVHEPIDATFATDFGVHGVHGCAWHRRDDGAFFTDHAIEQRGLADVGTSNNGDLYGTALFIRGLQRSVLRYQSGSARDQSNRGIEEVVYAGAVLGGDGEHGNAETMESGRVRFLQGRIDLVYRDKERF